MKVVLAFPRRQGGAQSPGNAKCSPARPLSSGGPKPRSSGVPQLSTRQSTEASSPRSPELCSWWPVPLLPGRRGLRPVLLLQAGSRLAGASSQMEPAAKGAWVRAAPGSLRQGHFNARQLRAEGKGGPHTEPVFLSLAGVLDPRRGLFPAGLPCLCGCPSPTSCSRLCSATYWPASASVSRAGRWARPPYTKFSIVEAGNAPGRARRLPGHLHLPSHQMCAQPLSSTVS